ncbi:hypothetical protein [uncultured Rikenella sp.]|uniref:hypothetical protein n=1 Tax=uncultured Rikenella sp. TaxID=368003 RepID=UPI0025E9AC54|nr:hypothetical protein [uncultured Rikenella sp.]
MEILLVTGEHDTGKSGVLHDLTKWFQDEKGYTISHTFHDHPFVFPKPEEEYDFEVLLSGKKRILIHSATDDCTCISNLCDNLATLKQEGNSPDILITTCRRFDDDTRKCQCSRMNWKPDDIEKYNVLHAENGDPILEIPLIRIKRENDKDSVAKWYHEQINRLVQHILQQGPYNIK